MGQVDRMQDMQGELSSIRMKRECSRARQKTILSRTSKQRYARAIHTENSILESTPVSTEQYLNDLRRSQQDNAIVYN